MKVLACALVHCPVGTQIFDPNADVLLSGTRSPQQHCLDLAPSELSVKATSFSGRPAIQQHQSKMLLPPWFIIGMVLRGCWAVFGLYQTLSFGFKPNGFSVYGSVIRQQNRFPKAFSVVASFCL